MGMLKGDRGGLKGEGGKKGPPPPPPPPGKPPIKPN